MDFKDGYLLDIHGSDNRPDSNYDFDQLKMGIETELEHTEQRKIAKIIAKDHLDEIPDYYTKLKIMEENVKGTSPKELENLF